MGQISMEKFSLAGSVVSGNQHPEFAEVLRQQRSRFVRMLQELELTEDERATAEGDAVAVGKLLDNLAGTPTPDGRGSLGVECEPPPRKDASTV